MKATAKTTANASSNNTTASSDTPVVAARIDPDTMTADNLPPDQVVTLVLDRAVQLPASDVFFETNEDYVAVVVRHLGLRRPMLRLPVSLGQRCIAHIKALADMDVAEHRRPLDGRWIRHESGRWIDLRINTIPTLHGEDCCLRIMMRDMAGLQMKELGFIRKEMTDLLAMLNSPSGLILVAGPTGSGKTTTVYACLRYLNNGDRKINTIEDPIEYNLPGIRQSQVSPKIGLDFPDLLRSVLRQAPDVIVIGEIRDPVTAATAVHAANSGHLVLATVHAPVAFSVVQSMRAWGVPSHFLATSLVGVLAQRLLRTLCPACKLPFPLDCTPTLFEDVKRWLGPDEALTLCLAKGCPECHGTGYASRTGVFEIMRVSHAMRSIISEGKPVKHIRQMALEEGLIELRQAALLKVAQGLTTAEEVVRAMPAEELGLED
jgi:type II secretory ATPase GspE/PulE/Tfp pilus assembly ATPase PilB-like protein